MFERQSKQMRYSLAARRNRLLVFTAICLFSCCVFRSTALASEPSRPPNVVIVFTDDQGYADVGCFGATTFKTPHLDQMAKEGMRFTNFYVAQAVCGASRAALLTGCYPNRIGLLGAPSHATKTGIHEGETTIAELLKQKEYATAIFGKWHLGHHEQFLPLQHGFDEYFGLPYSNDMWPYHPTSKAFPDLPLIEGNKIFKNAVTPEDQTQLTTWYTERALKFIDKNKDRPFFLYVAHAMPHVPLFVSDKFKGKSEQGLFGDVISEIDWSVGQINAKLKELGLEENTLVIFTSDNGPWLSYGDHAGSAGPLREGKGTAWEGGVREPCIMKWLARIPAGSQCDELAATIDILPTLAEITGAKLPERKIDGKSILPLMENKPDAKTPHEAYFYYYGNGLHAVRSGKWKLYFPHQYRSLDGPPGRDGLPSQYVQRKCGLELYDLEADIGEQHDLAANEPEIVKRLSHFADQMREDLGDSFQKQRGKEVRQPGRIE